jgi:hypothetical protein
MDTGYGYLQRLKTLHHPPTNSGGEFSAARPLPISCLHTEYYHSLDRMPKSARTIILRGMVIHPTAIGWASKKLLLYWIIGRMRYHVDIMMTMCVSSV